MPKRNKNQKRPLKQNANNSKEVKIIQEVQHQKSSNTKNP